MRAYDLSPDDVVNALSTGNAITPSGNLPLGDKYPFVPVNSVVRNAADLETIPLRTGPKAPVKTLRLGRIKAAIWENESDNQKFYGVTFARGYMDEAKNWHDSDSFGRDDLLLVAKLADQAHTFIFEQCAHAKAEPGG